MSATLAAIRSSEIDVPLVLHVLGAMSLVGLLLGAVVALLASARADDDADAAGLTRLGLWSLLGALPAWIVMRIGAQWTYAREGWDEAPEDPAWLGVGYVTADVGGVLLLIGCILAVVGLRRRSTDAPRRLGRAAGAIAALLMLGYVVAIWAMTAKPD